MNPDPGHPTLSGRRDNGRGIFLLRGETRALFSPRETPIANVPRPRPVAESARGELVLTRDNGFQPVLWAGRWRVPPRVLADDPRHWPVVIDRALPGAGCPTGALRLSAQHQVLLRDPWFELTTGSTEVLTLAGALGRAVAPAPGQEVIWHHLLFARHEIIQAAGLWVESLFSGGSLFADLPPILRLRAQAALGVDGCHQQTARPCLKRWEAEVFLRLRASAPQPDAARVA